MVQSTHTTAGFGPVLRWNVRERKHWTLFSHAGVDFLQTGSIAYIIPWPGVGYNFLVWGRGGAALRLPESYWLETSLGWAHVTSGFGGSGQLLPWSGQGASLGRRHTFARTPAKSSLDKANLHPSAPPPSRQHGDNIRPDA
jgi:hypothetical protein